MVEGLRRGEARAFDAAWAVYRPRIYAFLLRMSRRRSVAEDLLQDTFVALARSAKNLEQDTRLEAWLFTVAHNAYRSHRRWEVLDLSRFVASAEDAEGVADGAAQQGLEIQALERALLSLPEAERELLLLVGVEGVDQQTAAEILGVQFDALRKRLSRARAMLKDKLAELEGRSR